jgi:vancomycin permeability regulator SanA
MTQTIKFGCPKASGKDFSIQMHRARELAARLGALMEVDALNRSPKETGILSGLK